MPARILKTKSQVLRDILARAVSRSGMSGIRKNSGLYHIAASAAEEDADLYLQLALVLVEDFHCFGRVRKNYLHFPY